MAVLKIIFIFQGGITVSKKLSKIKKRIREFFKNKQVNKFLLFVLALIIITLMTNLIPSQQIVFIYLISKSIENILSIK